jgi:hypothetical protein
MVRSRFVLIGVSCLLTLGLIAGLSRSQETQEKKKEGAAKSDEKVKKAAIPDYFGQIGLSDKQKEDVRKAAQPFDDKIASLRKQIAELQKQIDEQEAAKLAECEKLLNDGQKQALKGRREAAESEKASKKKKTANGNSAKTEEKKP